MANRYPATHVLEQCLDTRQYDNEFQVPDGIPIEEPALNTGQNGLLETLPSKGEVSPNDASKDFEGKISSEKEAEYSQRLQQAVHILVNGAIRAAQKQRFMVKNQTKKPDKPTLPSMSDIQTSAEIGCKSMQEFLTKKTCKKSHLGRTAEGLIVQVQ